MPTNLSLNELYTAARHLTNRLDELAPSTAEYQAVRYQLQVNQATIHAVTQGLRALGHGLIH